MYESIGSAEVIDVEDPQGRGRVQVLPVGVAGGIARWARVSTPYSGNGYGMFFTPEVGDEVLVAFATATSSEPVVLGSLSRASDARVESDPEVKSLKTKAGHELVFSDQKVELKTASGHYLSLDDSDGSVTLSSEQGDLIKLDRGTIQLEAGIKIEARSSTLEIDAANISVNAPVVQFSGVLQCDSLLASSVVSANYSPGVGNLK
ncbi:phage baseplate assembly protein V [Pelagicoccus albus]|uniref:Type IV secretion protein Rhs n=1 Tax=Pelagicoccus albus TaxID=415222 RepID=A0A7X1B3E0_9BACT|nr:phage baseplate assembly protein V [Pelagicoccus albus]MBC2604913.1 type IV secretion protein Rhs [Pelagicoccus albus]